MFGDENAEATLGKATGDTEGTAMARKISGSASTPQTLVQRYNKGPGVQIKVDNPETLYTMKHEIGRGKFSVIKRCLDKKTNKALSAKLVKFDDESREDTLREFEIHRSIKGDNIVMLRDAFLVRKYLVLIMDIFEGKDILTFIGEKPRANEEDICFVLRPLLGVVNYLHNQHIVHLDIRPASIYVQKNYTLKITDFGCARKISNWESGEVGAPVGNAEFTAPEVLNFEPVHWGADMWSIGVLSYALLSASLPFTGADEDEVEAAVISARWKFDPKKFSTITAEAKTFVTTLLDKRPSNRLTADSCLKHEWMSGDNLQKRRSSNVPSPKMKDLHATLNAADEDEFVSASCVLRSFDEDEYESPESEDEDED